MSPERSNGGAQAGPAACVGGAAVLLGWAVQVDLGRATPLSLPLLVLALALLGVGALRAARGVGGDTGLRPLLLAGIGMNAACSLAAEPGLYLSGEADALDRLRLTLWAAGLGLACVLAGPGWLRWLLLGALGWVQVCLAGWMIAGSPQPSIDVFFFHEEAAARVLAGGNPYAMDLPDIYGDGAGVYPESLRREGRLQTGYPYPAGTLWAAAAAVAGGGDPRWAFAFSWLVTAAVVASQGVQGPALAALLLSLPRGLFLMEQAWPEPWVLLWFVLVLVAAGKRSRLLPWLFGLLLAAMPYAVALAPIGGLIAPSADGRTRWRWWMAVAAGFLAPAVPFLIADPAAYLGSVYGYAWREVWRLDSLSLLGLLTRHPEGAGWPAWIAAGAVAVWAIRSFAPGAESFALTAVLVWAAWFAFGRNVGCNHWMLMAGGLIAAASLLFRAPARVSLRVPGLTASGVGRSWRAFGRWGQIPPVVWMVIGLSGVATLLGVGWVGEDASAHELLANLAKARDLAAGLDADGDFPWWTPHFYGGGSMAPALGALGTYVWMLAGMAAAGLFAGPKLAALLQIPLAGLAMYGLARRVSGDRAVAALAGLFYAVGPQLAIALAQREHMVVVFAWVWPPLILLGLVRLRESGGWFDAAWCAAALAAMGLTWVKSAVALLPLLGMAVIWLWASDPEGGGGFRGGGGGAGLLAVPLWVLPLLPLVRESQFMALFTLDPFEAWQRSFSLKSVVSWIDRAGVATAGASGSFEVEEGRFYWGWIALAVVLGGVWSERARARLLGGPTGAWFRFCALAAFGLQWLSLGPRNLLQGTVEWLGSAQAAPNWSVPAGWAVLVLACGTLWHLLPCRSRAARFGWVVVFLVVPGFRLLDSLPGFDNLRAPWAIWEAGGWVCLSLAAALGCAASLSGAGGVGNRWTCPAALAALALLDASAYWQSFRDWRLPAGTFRDFIAAATFLRDAPAPGRVHAVSGRYFPLLLPMLTGRGLVSEAFHGQFALRWQRLYERAGYESPERLQVALATAGAAYVLIDKQDPDTPGDLQEFLRLAFATVAFENEHFAVLAHGAPLGPVWRAREFVRLDPGSYRSPGEVLSLARFGFLGVEIARGERLPPGLSGGGNAQDGIRLDPSTREKGGTPFEPVAGLEQVGFRTFALTAVDRPAGWVVLSQSFHPDWQAFRGEARMPVRLATGGGLAVYDEGGSEPLVFRFEPPRWYGWAVGGAGIAWLAVGLATAREGVRRVRRRALMPPVALAQAGRERGALERVLAVVPTYNEVGTIGRLVDAVLAQDRRVEVLVVDDASPDGTAAVVRGHAAFGSRVHLIEREGKRGLGTAYREGFGFALARGYDACVQIDADFSHDPADIPRLLSAVEEGADLAAGSRYLRGVRVVDWPIGRLLLSAGAGFYVRALTGLPMTDPTSGFKVVRREVLAGLEGSPFTAGGYSFQIELHYFAWRAGFEIRELPIVFTERRGGASKMSRAIAWEAAVRVLRLGVLGR